MSKQFFDESSDDLEARRLRLLDKQIHNIKVEETRLAKNHAVKKKTIHSTNIAFDFISELTAEHARLPKTVETPIYQNNIDVPLSKESIQQKPFLIPTTVSHPDRGDNLSTIASAIKALPAQLTNIFSAMPPIALARPTGSWVIDLKRGSDGKMSQMVANFHESQAQ